jgi:hypothetical protein
MQYRVVTSMAFVNEMSEDDYKAALLEYDTCYLAHSDLPSPLEELDIFCGRGGVSGIIFFEEAKQSRYSRYFIKKHLARLENDLNKAFQQHQLKLLSHLTLNSVGGLVGLLNLPWGPAFGVLEIKDESSRLGEVKVDDDLSVTLGYWSAGKKRLYRTGNGRSEDEVISMFKNDLQIALLIMDCILQTLYGDRKLYQTRPITKEIPIKPRFEPMNPNSRLQRLFSITEREVENSEQYHA